MSASIPSLDNSLIRWRNNLIDLTRRNPLLSLRPGRSSILEITAPDLTVIFEHLVIKNKTFTFWLPPAKVSSPTETAAKAPKKKAEKPDPPKATELVTAEPDRQRLLQILTNLFRRFQADYRERGLHILYLGAGILEWRDSDDEPMHSPLLLVPVVLKRKSLQEPFLLDALEEEPFLNPALKAKLKQDFDFSLPTPPEDWEEKALPAYLAEVAAAIQGLPGWKVEPVALLSLFSFFKGVIFQDLQENADQVKVHPVVQALAGLPTTLKRAQLPNERDLDDQQDPAQTYHILDADGSQRLCLEAALREESFVLIGPPGTGKSQTIANLIADNMARGKRVLFVSEKMAALEVVYQRLRQVGLGDFCLELHSYKASKRAVVTELARCLEERQKLAPAGSFDFAKLKERRTQLNRYVRALHAVREPMRRSAWDVLAELSRWNHLAPIPLGLPLTRQENQAAGALIVTDILPAQLDDLKQMLARLQQLWHIRAEAHYPWKGFKADRFTLQLRDEVVTIIDKVRGRLEKLQSVADQFAAKIECGAGLQPADGNMPVASQPQVGWLLKLGEILESRPGVLPISWFRETDISALHDELEKCAGQYEKLAQARAPLTQKYGDSLWRLLPGTAAKIEDAWRGAQKWLPEVPGAPSGRVAASLLASQQRLRAWAADTLKKIPGWIAEARTLDKWLALPLPTGAGAEQKGPVSAESRLDPSPHTLRQLLRLANLCMAENAPERPWLQSEDALKVVQEMVDANRPVFSAFRERRQRLLQTYEETFFELELERIAKGYAGPYQSWLRILNGMYRRDRRAIKRRTKNDVLPDSVAEDVALGRDLVAEKARLEADGPKRRSLMGRFETGLNTDWDAAQRAGKIAAEAFQIVRQLECDGLPPRFLDVLCSPTPPAEKIRAAFQRLNDSFGAWQRATQELKELLPVQALPGTNFELDEAALSLVANYARDLQTSLNTLGGLTDQVLAHAPAPPADLTALIADLRQTEELRLLEVSQEAELPRWTERFGPEFQGINTNWDKLRKGLAWTRRLRETFAAGSGTAVLPGAFIALVTAPAPLPSVRDLKSAQEHYEQSLHGFEIRFDAPGPLLDGKRYLEQTPAVVLRHLSKLRERVGELSDWIDFRHLPDRFAHLGLRVFWDNLWQDPPPPEQVIDIFLKSFWSAWIEAIFAQDPVLLNFRRGEHEQLLAEFRALDKQSIKEGAGRVAQGILHRNPVDTLVAESSLLFKEAHKKTKHLPLRRLFQDIPKLVLNLKPCLLMSPLSVSQFLPAAAGKMLFDVVVFDEASQILPEDALGAIYRGKQVVVTGDNQQLPPTTFFQQIAGGDDYEETAGEDSALFESILDACLGAGLPRQLLRWHYRSRHEHLIAFSNERFYEGRLVTFPAALSASPDLGVKFQHVPDGIYDRGGRRDNPREAQIVADLVLDHFRVHPDLTLGVIAFSYSQMNAIEDEIDRRLRAEPGMERFFQGDRLEGFFVKNLETVQGDERDVIFLSVGYGRDAEGKLAHHFGPLNRDGGARRLNVAVTRARRKLMIVSSLQACDLDAAASDNVAHLRQYLDFAQRGITALRPKADESRNGQATHNLEAEVLEELNKLGYQGVPQVGCGAYRIDLAVVDPKNPGRFVLGIEFDGPSYNQAGTARDRDRLRPEVLQQLGWKLERIWSPDWLYRRTEVVQRLAQILQAAG